ncbi:MAG: hypothetical protein M0R33_04210 [Methylomonas sp.]|jgi:NADH:ubiquinone oxidoreductase subunit 6 (subunit J)|uniref:hypothetical protein n=1 Tax=Methylomonas sp. TaxID=418 RepID=UPI0025E7F1E8|nr:hypothetical protein [Methylomonas sp.]MCK9605638.1 hypothetical protein [Methylomonas sp.]
MTEISLGGDMNVSNKLYNKLIGGFLFMAGLLSVLPAEFVVSVFLFIGVTYSGVVMIKSAMSYDLKTKRSTKT